MEPKDSVMITLDFMQQALRFRVMQTIESNKEEIQEAINRAVASFDFENELRMQVERVIPNMLHEALVGLKYNAELKDTMLQFMKKALGPKEID